MHMNDLNTVKYWNVNMEIKTKFRYHYGLYDSVFIKSNNNSL